MSVVAVGFATSWILGFQSILECEDASLDVASVGLADETLKVSSWPTADVAEKMGAGHREIVEEPSMACSTFPAAFGW